MKNILLCFLLSPFLISAQVQIGQKISPDIANERSGSFTSLSDDGQTVAIGAMPRDSNNITFSRARVFTFDGQSWIQKGQNLDILNNNLASYWTNCRVSLSGDGNILAISNPLYGNNAAEGITRVYQYIGNSWSQVGQDILGSQDDHSGYNISLSNDGTILAIISSGQGNGPGANNGNVTIFQYNNSSWQQLGQTIEGYFTWTPQEQYNFFQASVSLSNSGHKIAIGTPDSYSSVGVNQVKIFEYKNSSWQQLGQSLGDPFGFPVQGWDVSLAGNTNTLAVSSVSTIGPGMVQIFELDLDNDQWNQKGGDINGDENYDFFGHSISISDDGNILAVGAPLSNLVSSYQKGKAKFFKFMGNDWSQVGVSVNGIAGNDLTGNDVSLSSSGQFVAVGSPQRSNYPYVNAGEVIVYDLFDVLSVIDNKKKLLELFPNPAQKSLTISIDNESELVEVNIYNMLGQLVKNEQNTLIDVSNLANGSYIVQVVTQAGKMSEILIKN